MYQYNGTSSHLRRSRATVSADIRINETIYPCTEYYKKNNRVLIVLLLEKIFVYNTDVIAAKCN